MGWVLAINTSRKGTSDTMGFASTGAASWGSLFRRLGFFVVAVTAIGCTSRAAGVDATPLSPAIGGSGVGWILWILSVVVVGISVARRASASVVVAARHC